MGECLFHAILNAQGKKYLCWVLVTETVSRRFRRSGLRGVPMAVVPEPLNLTLFDPHVTRPANPSAPPDSFQLSQYWLEHIFPVAGSAQTSVLTSPLCGQVRDAEHSFNTAWFCFGSTLQ